MARTQKPDDSGRFRIIGGSWRGRRLNFPALRQLRPTPDRVRETVFNWLQPVIAGARCLDLYAGSGALGLEALSRGAASCVFVDRETRIIETLRDHLKNLGSEDGILERGAGQTYLDNCYGTFDVIFLDPPFESRPWDRILQTINTRGLLNPGGLVYLENLAVDGPPALPAGWELLRAKRAGRVGYYLASQPGVEAR